MHASGFICIIPAKAVCLGPDKHIHRDECASRERVVAFVCS